MPSSDIVARARELRLNHPDQSFNTDYAKVYILERKLK